MENKSINYIHLVGGEVGGVGKSTFCKLLIEYLQSQDTQIPFYLVDADVGQPNVGYAYANDRYKSVYNLINSRMDDQKVNLSADATSTTEDPLKGMIYFSDDVDKLSIPDQLIDLADTHHHVIVNLPSNVMSSFTKWVNFSGVFNNTILPNTKFVYWFVAKPIDPCVKALNSLHETYGSNMQIVCVLNLIRNSGGNWQDVYSGLSVNLKSLKVIQIPDLVLSGDERKAMFSNHESISSIIDNSKYNKLARNRVQNWMNLVVEDLKKVFPAVISDGFGSTSNDATSDGSKQKKS